MTGEQIPIKEYLTGNTKHRWDLKKTKSSYKISAEYKYKKGEKNLSIFYHLFFTIYLSYSQYR